MREQLEAFLLQIPQLTSQTPADLIDFFVYFLTVILGKEVAKPSEIETCFDVAHLPRYSNISAYVSRHSKRKKRKTPKFIHVRNGYQLARPRQLELQKTLHTGPAKVETSLLLRGLLTRLAIPQEQAFLLEAIDCYEIGARRAAIIMVWILTVHHLYQYILKHELVSFNTALAKVKDKRIKITVVSKLDDFTEIPEGKFIEIMRSANIITNDVRKILETKLGIRNSCAHPSGITVSDVKATEFIIDLVENVIFKYTL